MPLMNIFTFLTFTRPLAILSDISTAFLKHSLTFVAIYAEEGYSILTIKSTKVFKSVTTNIFLISYYVIFTCEDMFMRESSPGISLTFI